LKCPNSNMLNLTAKFERSLLDLAAQTGVGWFSTYFVVLYLGNGERQS